MNPGIFQTQLNAAWNAITELRLNENRNWRPDYSLSGPSYFRHLSYADTWRNCVAEQLYDFQLVDNSLIQFRVASFSPLDTSFAYYECPYQGMTYREFVADIGLDIKDVRDELRSDYENYLTTCNLKETVTPIRYDFSPKLYTSGLHPASHVHFGYDTQIRVGTMKVLRPMSFFLLILRQCYPEKWREFVSTAGSELLCRNIRDNLDDVESKFWQRLDSWEMSLM